MIRRGWIDAADRVPLLRQCALAGVKVDPIVKTENVPI